MQQLTLRTKFHRLALGLASVAVGSFLMACTTVWQPARGQLATPHWSIQMPDGWMRLVTPAYEMFSKDGPYLQYILIQHRPLSQGFQFTRQNIEGGMLPHEMARVLIDNIHSDPLIRNFKLLSDVPAKVGGRAGFRLIYTYQDRQGVDMKTVYYGTVMGPYYFNLRYTAALRHYFAADLPTFDQVRAGLQLFPDSGALSVPDSNSR